MPSENVTVAIDNLTTAVTGIGTSFDGMTAAITGIATAITLLVAAIQIMRIFELALLIGFLALAYWRQEEVLFAASAVITILIAFEWVSTYPGIAVILWAFGLYLVGFKVIIPIMAGGSARGFSQFKAMFHRVKGEE